MSNQSANFSVQNIYIKDVSFEAPNTPAIFSREWQPKVHFDLGIGREALEENHHEVVLTVTVTVDLPKTEQDKKTPPKPATKSRVAANDVEAEEGITTFLVEIHQAGIFLLEGFDEEQTEQVLSIAAPNILFPYARELISSLVTRGGFPQLVLPPMNFEAMYQQHLDEAKAKEEEVDA